VLPGFVHIELNNSQELRAAVHENTCAVMLEPLLAEGGLLQLNADFVQTLNELKDEYGFIVIADEIQTGMGVWAHFGVRNIWICAPIL
jgi:acetylornithine/N-succinyldiaminopimelate aminotransferase